jgi:hypothetical protein
MSSKTDNLKRWLALIGLSAYFGLMSAEMIVYLPDWINALMNAWRL